MYKFKPGDKVKCILEEHKHIRPLIGSIVLGEIYTVSWTISDFYWLHLKELNRLFAQSYFEPVSNYRNLNDDDWETA